MKKIISELTIGIILFSHNCHSQAFVLASQKDSLTVASILQKKWMIIGYKKFDFANLDIPAYHCLYSNNCISFSLGSAVIFEDTFYQPHYVIERVCPVSGYLKEYYNLDKFQNADAQVFRVVLSSKILPQSIHSLNPNYEYSVEFVIVGDELFYDQDGIVYEASHIRPPVLQISNAMKSGGLCVSVNKNLSEETYLYDYIKKYEKNKKYYKETLSENLTDFYKANNWSLLAPEKYYEGMNYYMKVPFDSAFVKSIFCNNANSPECQAVLSGILSFAESTQKATPEQCLILKYNNAKVAVTFDK